MMSHHPQRKLSFSVIWRVVQEGGPAVPDPLGTDPAQWREECRVSPPRSAKTSRGLQCACVPGRLQFSSGSPRQSRWCDCAHRQDESTLALCCWVSATFWTEREFGQTFQVGGKTLPVVSVSGCACNLHFSTQSGMTGMKNRRWM